MTDGEFLDALETCALPPAEFGHAGHVRAGYLYLRNLDFAAALASVRTTIRRYADSLGQSGRYHETKTLAYLALINQHLDERGDGGGWDRFAAANPELLQPDLIARFYARAQLDTDQARRIFVLPRPLSNASC